MRLRIRTEKNGVWVTLRLSFVTTQALEKLPRVSGELFFEILLRESNPCSAAFRYYSVTSAKSRGTPSPWAYI